MKNPGVCSTVHELDNRPVPFDDHVHDLDLPIGKCRTPPHVVLSVTVGTHLKFAASHILKTTVVGDHGDTALGVSQVPGLVEYSNDAFCLGHGSLLNLASGFIAIQATHDSKSLDLAGNTRT